jgi:hypothetical protein
LVFGNIGYILHDLSYNAVADHFLSLADVGGEAADDTWAGDTVRAKIPEPRVPETRAEG